MSAAWQRVLDRHADLFEEIEEGASVAVVPRSVVAPVCDPAPMLLWVREPDGMTARSAEFSGFKTLASDLLLVTNDGTLETALSRDEPRSTEPYTSSVEMWRKRGIFSSLTASTSVKTPKTSVFRNSSGSISARSTGVAAAKLTTASTPRITSRTSVASQMSP